MSRKISMFAVSAFETSNSFNKDNTSVSVDWRKVTLSLHWSAILERFTQSKDVYFSLAWWNTNTTKERINCAISIWGKIRTVKGVPTYFMGNWEKIVLDVNEWYCASNWIEQL